MTETSRGVGYLLPATSPPTAARKRPRWAVVIAVVSIIFGSLPAASLLICLALLILGRGPLMDILQLEGLVLALTIATGCYVFGMSLLLFVGGVGLMLRRPWGRTLHLVYAWIFLGLMAAYTIWWGLAILASAQEGRPALEDQAWRSIGPWLPNGWYPLFLIIWFMWPRIRKEVASW